MSFGAPSKLDLSINRPRWRIEQLHRQIQIAVRIGITDDLPLTRRLLAGLLQRAGVDGSPSAAPAVVQMVLTEEPAALASS